MQNIIFQSISCKINIEYLHKIGVNFNFIVEISVGVVSALYSINSLRNIFDSPSEFYFFLFVKRTYLSLYPEIVSMVLKLNVYQ